jgi:hypothetical protein
LLLCLIYRRGPHAGIGPAFNDARLPRLAGSAGESYPRVVPAEAKQRAQVQVAGQYFLFVAVAARDNLYGKQGREALRNIDLAGVKDGSNLITGGATSKTGLSCVEFPLIVNPATLLKFV